MEKKIEEQLRKIWDNGRFAEANTGDLQNPKYNDNVEKMWKVFIAENQDLFSDSDKTASLQSDIERWKEEYVALEILSRDTNAKYQELVKKYERLEGVYKDAILHFYGDDKETFDFYMKKAGLTN